MDIADRRYLKMEDVLINMNPRFITVKGDDVKRTNTVLKYVLGKVIGAMKEVSTLFDELYETNYWGGSFYDGIKVGKPNEFDLDLKLKLPELVGVVIEPASADGFVYLHMSKWNDFKKNTREYMRYKGLENFKDSSNYLKHDQVLQWMESIVQKALNKTTTYLEYQNKYIVITTQKNGPAVTLRIVYDNMAFDVDLVAVIKLTNVHWPKPPFRQLSYSSQINQREFFAVPKAPNVYWGQSKYWRLSFQIQEQQLINDLNNFKPALRLLKKFRDSNDHNIPSYYIKTVFLWEIEELRNHIGRTWTQPLSVVFMHMLKRYRDYLASGNLPYYWNSNNNLLANINASTIENIKNYVTAIIKKIDREIDNDKYIAAKYILTIDEFMAFSDKLQYPEIYEKENTHNIITNSSWGCNII